MTTDANSLSMMCKHCGTPLGQNMPCPFCYEYLKQETQRLASFGTSPPVHLESKQARLERVATSLLAGMMACPVDFYEVNQGSSSGLPPEQLYIKIAIRYAKALIEAIEKEGK